MVLTLDPAPNAPSYSNPDTFEPDTSNYLAWMKTIRDQLSGQALELYDFGLGTTITAPMLSNIDATDTPIGWYLFTNGAGTKPSGIGPYANVRIDRYNQDTFRQTWVGYRGEYFTRFCDRGVFGAWVSILPERGSGPNGEWVRLADGTQICWHILSTSSSAGVAWTFPAAFTAAPVVTGIPRSAVLSSLVHDIVPSATSATLSARDKNDLRRADTTYLTAIGRYK